MYNIRDIARLSGNELTDEQMNVIDSMTDSIIINANPGTGKTTTMIYGVINLVLNKNVKPERILCMSYSRESAKDLQLKYVMNLRKAIGQAAELIKSPEFSTFHSFCLKQVESHQIMNNDKDEMEVMKNYFIRIGNNLSKDVQYNKLYRVFKYITTFGISNEKDLMNCKEYQSLCIEEDLTFKDIINWYASFFKYKSGTGYFTQGDIPLIVLDRLVNNPDFSNTIADKYDYVIIDEMQDMNVIYLITLSYFAKYLIAIGDIKQQIYRYNGSDDSIINLFEYAYPNAKVLQLTQSFRCDKRIAEYASNIIKENKYENFNGFTGLDNNGGVHLMTRTQFYEALKMMSHKFVERNEWDEYMFLYRFNMTGIIAAHELYNYNYAALYEMEYIKSLYDTYQLDKGPIDKYYIASLNIENDKLTAAYKRVKKNNTPFLHEIKQENLTDEEKRVVTSIETLHQVTNTKSKIKTYIEQFKQYYTIIFRKKNTMFKFDEYLKLLDEYSESTFEEFIEKENFNKDNKKLKSRFPIHYPKYKQIYTMDYLNDIQLIWDIYRNPYNPNTFETFFRKSKFKVKNRDSAVKTYMKENNCSYKEAIDKCVVSDAERNFLNVIQKIINVMSTKPIITYIDSFKDVVAKYFDKSSSYLEWHKRDIEFGTYMLVHMYPYKLWNEMLEAEDEKYQHIQTTISLDYGIKFKTMHASKGLEAKKVIILDYEADAIAPLDEIMGYVENKQPQKAVESLRDDRCLLFVGLTRAISDVYCVYDGSPTLIDVNYYKDNRFKEVDSLHVNKIKRNILLSETNNIRVVVHGSNEREEDIFSENKQDDAVQEMIEFLDTIENI